MRALTVFLALAVGHALYAVFQYHLLYPELYAARLGDATHGDPVAIGILHELAIRRVSSSFGNPNLLAAFIAMALPPLAAVGWTLGRVKNFQCYTPALIVFPLLGLLLYVLHRTDSTGGRLVAAVGLVGILGALLLKAWIDKGAGRKTALALAAVFILGLGSFALDLGPKSLKENSGISTQPRSQRTLMQRVYYLQSAWSMFRERPVTGHGVGAFERLYPRHRVAGSGEARYAHNFIAQTAVETGLVGLVLLSCFGLLFFAALLRGIIRTWPHPSPGWLAAAALPILFLGDSLGEYSFYVRELLLTTLFFTGLTLAAAPARERTKPSHLHRYAPALCAVLLVAGFWPVVVEPLLVRHHLRSGRAYLEELALSPSLQPRRRLSLLERSMSHVGAAVRLQDKNPEAWTLAAAAREAQGNLPAALEAMEQAVRLAPESASIRAQTARYQWAAGQTDAALESARLATQLHPLDARHRLQYARYLAALDRQEEAVQEARRALDDATLPQDIEEAGSLLFRLGATWEKTDE